MRNRSSVLLAAAAVSSLVLASTSDAHAQTVIVQQQPQPVQVQQVQPVYPPGYAPGYGPGYTTPIYQETQPSYVPQSVAMSGPRIIRDWNEGEPIPPGYHETTRIRKGLVAAGASIFGGMYLFTILGASLADASCNSGLGGGGSCATALFAPIVGPFIQMGQCSGTCALGDFWLGFDGVVQAAGVAMFIAGLAAPTTVLVRNDLGYEAPKAPKLALTPVPLVSPTMQGMGLIGRF